jgi:hypothetical protein
MKNIEYYTRTPNNFKQAGFY